MKEANGNPSVLNPADKRPELLDLWVNLWGLVSACGVIAATATVLGFFGRLWWVFDLFSHFRVQLLATLITAATVHLIRRDYMTSAAFVVLGAVNLSTILPLCFGGVSVVPAGAVSYRAMLANVNTRLGNPLKVSAAIEQLKPDVLVLEEVDEAWVASLSTELKAYPYSTAMPRDDNFGIAVYSKYPMRGEIRYLGDSEVPSVMAEIESHAGSFTLIGTHALPPASAENTRLRDQHLSLIPHTVRNAKSPVLLLGGLNATPWCPSFRHLLRGSGLRNSSQGLGVQATWPSVMPLLRIPIDHCLYGPGIQVADKRIGPNVGSDHYPVVVDFVLSSRVPTAMTPK